MTNDNRGLTATDDSMTEDTAALGGQVSSDGKSRNSGQAGGQSSSGSSKRGFASMDEDTRREIASKGGQAAHAKGTAHEWNSDEAREAGKKGGSM